MHGSVKSPLRIAVLDDHKIVLQGVESYLRVIPDFLIVGSYSLSSKLIEAVQSDRVNLAVIDFSLGDGQVDGLNLIQLLTRKYPMLKVVVLSSHYDAATAGMAIRAGALGYVGKIECLSTLVKAVRTVANGQSYLSPRIAAALSISNRSLDNEALASSPEQLITSAPLSAREREVLRCCLEGMRTTDIATKFSRSIKTISTQKHAAYKKLGITNDNELFKINALLRDL